jgi:hypothetical protein
MAKKSDGRAGGAVAGCSDMKRWRYVAVDVFQTLLRILPFPCKTGLITIGNPDRHAPVLLTGNFQLTVERVRHALTCRRQKAVG